MRSSRHSEAVLLAVLAFSTPLFGAGEPATEPVDGALNASAEIASQTPAADAVVPAEAGEPVPTRWRHFGRVLQVDRAERIALILVDPVPGKVPAECFSRDGEMKPTSRLTLLPVRRSGVFAALARGGLPEVGEEVVFDVSP